MPGTRRSKPDDPIGTRLARLRKAAGITQRELARRIGMPQSQISKYENGQLRLHAEALLEISQAIHATPNQILGLEATEPALLGTHRMRRLLHKAEALSRRDRQALLRTMAAFIRGNTRSSGRSSAADRTS